MHQEEIPAEEVQQRQEIKTVSASIEHTPEETEDLLQEALKRVADKKPIPGTRIEKCGEAMVLFKELMDLALEQCPLDILNAIKTKEEAEGSEVRERAKDFLRRISQSIKYLESRTDIGHEDLTNIKAQYKVFSRAVGMINSGMVDHTS